MRSPRTRCEAGAGASPAGPTLRPASSRGPAPGAAAQVRELAIAGQMTPGILEGAQSALALARKNEGGEPPYGHLSRSLAAVVELLQATLEALARLAPKSALADALVELDPEQAADAGTMLALLRDAFAPGGGVDKAEFCDDLMFFIRSADEQDAALLKGVAEGEVDLGEMKLEEVMAIRRSGVQRMQKILEMASEVV